MMKDESLLMQKAGDTETKEIEAMSRRMMSMKRTIKEFKEGEATLK
jgi:hypothetical protein